MADSVDVADRQPAFLKDKGDALYKQGNFRCVIVCEGEGGGYTRICLRATSDVCVCVGGGAVRASALQLQVWGCGRWLNLRNLRAA